MLEVFFLRRDTSSRDPIKTYVASLEVDPGETKEFEVIGLGQLRVDLSRVNGRVNGEHVARLDFPGLGWKEISVNRRTSLGTNVVGSGLQLGAELPGWQVVRIPRGRSGNQE